MDAREIIQRLKADGWYEVDGKGSHRNFKHLEKLGKVTVPFHGNKTHIGPALWKSIQRQAGWK